MADFADLGAERAQQMLDDALAAQRGQASLPAVEHLHCLDCGADIPPRRREVVPGVETCVDCQAIREARS